MEQRWSVYIIVYFAAIRRRDPLPRLAYNLK